MSVDNIRKLVALLASIVIIIALVIAQRDDNVSKPMLTNGDAVGMDNGESFSDYQQRVAPSVQREGIGFALVTFPEPLNDEACGELLNSWSIPRVDALVFPDRKPVELPEPVAPESRSDVVARAHRIDAQGWTSISGAIVHGPVAQIRELGKDAAAIEVLPEDAAWGRFGVQPVRVS